jgi:hypothetical protein
LHNYVLDRFSKVGPKAICGRRSGRSRFSPVNPTQGQQCRKTAQSRFQPLIFDHSGCSAVKHSGITASPAQLAFVSNHSDCRPNSAASTLSTLASPERRVYHSSMQRFLSIARRYSPWIAFAAALALLFAFDRQFLRQGFYVDDYFFLALVPKLGPNTFHLFSPYLKWFYRPLFLIYFSTVRTVFGPNSAVFHGLSLVLDAANVALLYCLVRRLTGRDLEAVIACALFFYVSLGSQAVWWISCASTLLAGMFYLLSLLSWINYREGGRIRWYGAAIAAMVCAMLSKEDAVSLPAALLLLDIVLFQGKATWRRRALEFGAIAVTTIVYLVLDITAARLVVWQGNNDLLSGNLGARLTTLGVFARNLIAALLPATDTVAHYGWPLCFLAAAVCFAARKKPALLFLATMFIVAVVPIPIAGGGHTQFDRFYYLPWEMLCALTGAGLVSLIASGGDQSRASAHMLLAGMIAGPISQCVFAGMDTITQLVALIAAVPLFWLAARAGLVNRSVAVGLTVTVAVSIADFASAYSLPLWVPPILAVVFSSIACLRLTWWLGAMAAVLFGFAPINSPALCAALYLIVNFAWIGVERMAAVKSCAASA